jgi:hypothetical protein
MARGRMINNAIVEDKRVNDLSDDTSRLAFTWLITFADYNGRVCGDPALLRSKLFPRRDDVTVGRMTAYIIEWAESGMVVWYEAKGDKWIEFPAFDKNQPNLRKDREPESDIPSPADGRILAGTTPDEIRPDDADNPDEIQQDAGSLPDDIRITSGCLPDNIPPKRREEKRREEKGPPPPSSPRKEHVSAAIRAFEAAIGLVSGQRQAEEMVAILDELHEKEVDGWWQTALDIAADQNKRSWAYVRAVLESHLRDGTPPLLRGSPREPPRPQKQVVLVRDDSTGMVYEREAVL